VETEIAYLAYSSVLIISLGLAWILSGKKRIAIETLILFVGGSFGILYALGGTDNTEKLVTISSVSVFVMLVFGYRFRSTFKNPFEDIMEMQATFINTKDFGRVTPKETGGYTGEMNTLLELETYSFNSLGDVLKNVQVEGKEIQSVSQSISYTTESMRSNVTQLRQDLDTILQSAVILNELTSKVRSNLQSIYVDMRKQFNVITSALESADRMSNQTNLIAVNAAIEAAHSGVHGEKFGVVADGIQELSSRTRKSTDDLSHTTRTINERLDAQLDLLLSDFTQINDLVFQMVDKSNAATTSTMMYSGNMKALDEFVNVIRSKSDGALKSIDDYSF
jgi:methyl-accepting chemotaxis protein